MINTEEKNTIRSVRDLKAEIARLTLRKTEQEAYLSDQYRLLNKKINGPIRFFNTLVSYVPGTGVLRGVVSGVRQTVTGNNKDADWLTKVLSLAAPFVLNSTLLKKSGWLKKALVLIASEKAVGQINQNSISNVITKVSSFISPKNKKKKKKTVVDSAYSDMNHDIISESSIPTS
ncbi:hypothetical protein ORI89_14430 [Sphingobacterium sp. UT-1RO-CII-1]|uniref:hypothetical protein n=1 Tax=Sphingobacterium sp. UT-1RO-CII-1 TaxID=2995225 RepID=UPI00227C78BE|nr:hypothetical protein [Sphingobacterium sp. UT-1RO-CII-1]MCY4780853.1 hypothetical protein [Sphingobacterium sp. UT-1RO-CII-1]